MASCTQVNINSVNCLLPLPRPMLTNHQWYLVAFTWGQFQRKCSRYLYIYLWYKFENNWFHIRVVPPRGQLVKLRGIITGTSTNIWINPEWYRYINHMDPPWIIISQKSTKIRVHNWGLWCQRQLSQAWISNCIPQYSVGCNYLSMPEITASGTKVLISRDIM